MRDTFVSQRDEYFGLGSETEGQWDQPVASYASIFPCRITFQETITLKESCKVIVIMSFPLITSTLKLLTACCYILFCINAWNFPFKWIPLFFFSFLYLSVKKILILLHVHFHWLSLCIFLYFLSEKMMVMMMPKDFLSENDFESEAFPDFLWKRGKLPQDLYLTASDRMF